MLEKIHAGLSRASQWAARLAGAALTLCAIMITIDVLARKLIGWSIDGSDEISGYVFAVATVWAFAFCLLHRANVRIDAVYNYLPHWLRAALDIISVALLLVFIGLVTQKAFFTVSESWKNNAISITPLKTPMWIPQGFWIAGLIFFVVVLVFVLVRTSYAFARGRLDEVTRVAGVLSREEEIAEETRGTEADTACQEGSVR
jgi:TRAP-type C4-dicarboxylate transport system permease small subunit